MKMVFADAWYFIALLNPDDQGHALAARWTVENPPHVVTTEFVLMEVADGLAKHGRRGAFGQWRQTMERRSALRLVPASHDLFERGVKIYLDRMDKEWTLTDCTSFVVMRDLGLTEALTADRHFEQAGMVPLLRSPD